MAGMDGDPDIPEVAVEEDPLVAITGGRGGGAEVVGGGGGAGRGRARAAEERKP